MYSLTLEWVENGRVRSQIVSLAKTIFPGIIRLGRSEEQCDLVVNDQEQTVSRLHAEIFYLPHLNTFNLRNITQTRPKPNRVVVDDKNIVEQVVPLHSGSVIWLGKVEIKVKEILLPQPKPKVTPKPLQTEPKSFMIKCPNGHEVPFEYANGFCPHCGTAVQSGGTVIAPQK